MTKRQKKIVDVYRKGLTLRECSRKLGISMQRVHQVVKECAPELMRPRFHYERKKKAA